MIDTPTHGPTGSPIVKSKLSVESNDEVHHYLPPPEPERTVYEWDENGDIVGERELTDEEFAAAKERHEAAMALWKRTGGTHISPGVPTYELDVECADGTTAHAVGNGEGVWRWTHWQTSRAGRQTRAGT